MGRSCYCCDKKDDEPCDLCADLSDDSSITKAKIKISGLQDYIFDEVYTDEFISVGSTALPPSDNTLLIGVDPEGLPNPQSGSFFKGYAGIRYILNITGLNQLNSEMDFDLVGNKFIPKQNSKFLGEVVVTTIVEHSLVGKGYASLPILCNETYDNNCFGYNITCQEPCVPTEECAVDQTPWPRLENCMWNYNNGYVKEIHEADIPSDWSGKIGVVYKYDFYLVAEEYTCNLGMINNEIGISPQEINVCNSDPFCYIDDNCKTPHFNHMVFKNGNSNSWSPALRLLAVLKETEIIEEGVYKNIGYYQELEQFSPCYQTRGGNSSCPILGQLPCSGLIYKAKLECRNSLYSYSIPGYGLHHDISEKIFFPYGCDAGRCFQNCFCEGFGPPSLNCPPSGQAWKTWSKCRAFEKHYNFRPFGNLSYFLHADNIPSFDGNCDLNSLPNLIKNYYFRYAFSFFDDNNSHNINDQPCYPNYDDPCLFCSFYDDAAKKIKQKYRVFSHESFLTFAQSQIVNFQNNTNYLKVFNPCDSKYYQSCDFSNTNGVGVLRMAVTNLYPYTDIDAAGRSFNFLDFMFTKFFNWNTNLYAFSPFSKNPDSNSNCWNYSLGIPSPFGGSWGSSELIFLKVKDQIRPGSPPLVWKYYPTPDNRYCHKTFYSHPNINWTSTGKNNDNEIIVGITLKTHDPKQPRFILPKPPESILEVEYE